MTQEELNHICNDICVHGRQVQGWSCEQEVTGRAVLTDNKRGHTWVRSVEGGPWTEGSGAGAPIGVAG